MITSLVYSPRVMQTLLWVSELGELRKRHCIVCPVSTDEMWVFWLCRWVSRLLWLAEEVITKPRQSPLRILGTSGLWWSCGGALHSIQGFWWLWVCWGVPITASLEEFDWCVIMRWDVSQPGNEEREGSPGESHFYNRLEATACKTSFINCRMNREERKAGLGLEWPHRPCSRV